MNRTSFLPYYISVPHGEEAVGIQEIQDLHLWVSWWEPIQHTVWISWDKTIYICSLRRQMHLIPTTKLFLFFEITPRKQTLHTCAVVCGCVVLYFSSKARCYAICIHESSKLLFNHKRRGRNMNFTFCNRTCFKVSSRICSRYSTSLTVVISEGSPSKILKKEQAFINDGCPQKIRC